MPQGVKVRSWTTLANPKSMIFTLPAPSMSTFSGLSARYATCMPWRYSNTNTTSAA